MLGRDFFILYGLLRLDIMLFYSQSLLKSLKQRIKKCLLKRLFNLEKYL